jgi:hypothetical protein
LTMSPGCEFHDGVKVLVAATGAMMGALPFDGLLKDCPELQSIDKGLQCEPRERVAAGIAG